MINMSMNDQNLPQKEDKGFLGPYTTAFPELAKERRNLQEQIDAHNELLLKLSSQIDLLTVQFEFLQSCGHIYEEKDGIASFTHEKMKKDATGPKEIAYSYKCPKCMYVSPFQIERCPMCGADFMGTYCENCEKEGAPEIYHKVPDYTSKNVKFNYMCVKCGAHATEPFTECMNCHLKKDDFYAKKGGISKSEGGPDIT